MSSLFVPLSSGALLLVLQACSSSSPESASEPDASALDGSDDSSIWNLPSSVLNPKALPLGDGNYTPDGPKKGYVFACDPKMYQFTTVIGAQVTGPWVDTQNKTFDVTAKVFVHGNVTWEGQFSVSVSGTDRVFEGNGLPVAVPTGTFPVQTSDPAYAYDRNPNAITPQSIAFKLPQNPTSDPQPHCTYKRIGITLDGVELDSPLDSSGRDENAYELADACGGKPQPGGSYHRQYLSDCVPHIRESAALVGYALDGFGIYSPFDANGKEQTSDDLDDCHGITSDVVWDGKTVTMYHYVMTRDFPYTLTCFRGAPNYDAFPPLPGLNDAGLPIAGDGGP